MIDLPEQVRGDSIEVELPLRLLANAAAFDAWVSSTTQPDIRQGFSRKTLGALTVFVPRDCPRGAPHPRIGDVLGDGHTQWRRYQRQATAASASGKNHRPTQGRDLRLEWRASR